MQLLGYPPEHFLQNNVTPFDLIEDDDKHNFTKQSHAAHFSLKPFELVYRINTLHGERKWVLDRGRCFRDLNGEHFVEGVILDITERELVRQQIEYLAVQDPLTELFNRYKFNDQLVSAVDEANRNQEHFAMLFIDLDRFKNINDSLGHQLGDRLLRKVASRLQNVIPDHHFLARMGGDEFVILMHHVQGEDEVQLLANEINRTLRKPFNIDSYQLRTSCSIGISMCPQHSTHSHILWRYADTAMYQVKNRGGDGYQFFTNEMGDSVQHRITIEHGFIPALENKQFELFYQPQVDMNNGEVIGAEALIRWNHPELGFISPAEFIPIAEETGFIHDLGDWIIQESLNQLSKWQQYKEDFSLAVNVSALQITEEFPHKLDTLVRQYKLRPFSLELEITESLLMENIEYVLPLLNQIRQRDIHFAIDDFGTGYSSLSYLRYLPIEKLKIDRAFVMNLETSEDDVTLVKAIVAMTKNLNLKVLAEGIETQQQQKILKDLGCESYQGYYFSKPVDCDTFYSLYINASSDVQSEL
jgi:diguanylate cyclase (GGDEF)-like protein